ncbi:MAG: hypothetical protein JRJ69_16715 [Deltaproteobacteria bacterium]|nr:hypothetical protein [Deltaproteobacteria bacterium]
MKRSRTKIAWTLVAATNSKEVLETNLLGSVEAESANELILMQDPESASHAYNEALCRSSNEILVFAHQDVYLPRGWGVELQEAISLLNRKDPDWGVAGVYGVTETGKGAGYVYSTGLRRFVGQCFSAPLQVRTLDEMLLIVRRSSGLQFDEDLPGFHLYGTDICLEAQMRGMKNYVLPCFTLHNSNGVRHLPLSFWQAYLYLRKKWRKQLPIMTPCTKITFACSPILRDFIRRRFLGILWRNNPGSRVNDPERFYEEELGPVLESNKCY